MKINIVVNSFPCASETFLFNLVTGLERRGMNVAVIAGVPSKDSYLYIDRLSEWSGRIKYIRGNSVRNFLFFVFSIVSNFNLFSRLKIKLGFRKAIFLTGAFKLLIQNKPDIIHFAFSGIAVKYLPIIKELNKFSNTIVSCRGSAEKVKPIVDLDRPYQLSELFQSISKIHCVSEDILNSLFLYGLNKNKVFINKPAIQLEKFQFVKRQIPKESEKFLIVTSGRLSFEKGYIFALLACSQLLFKEQSFEYHILGDGQDKQQLQYLIHELNLDRYVYLHGKVSTTEVRKYLSKAHVFLLPSIYEGISNAALEAMAMGVPLVTTNAGGMDEVVQNGKNGLVVQRLDQHLIASALFKVMANYKDALQMADNALETIRTNHQLGVQINIFIQEYFSLVGLKN